MTKKFREKIGRIPTLFLTKKRRGLSPIITSLLLIALVIVITSVVFLWFRGMVEEGVVKFGENIKLACEDVEFEATYSSGTINIVNTGNIPIFRVNIKMSREGSYSTKDLKNMSGGSSWPEGGLAQGGIFSGNIGGGIGSIDKIIVLPVLIGTSSKGKKTFICEGQYGKEINL